MSTPIHTAEENNKNKSMRKKVYVTRGGDDYTNGAFDIIVTTSRKLSDDELEKLKQFVESPASLKGAGGLRWVKVASRLPNDGGQYILRRGKELAIASITMANVDHIAKYFKGWDEWLDTESPSTPITEGEGWIDVAKYGFPENNNKVLCSNAHGVYFVLWYDHSTESWIERTDSFDKNHSWPITHWRPLPAPPIKS